MDNTKKTNPAPSVPADHPAAAVPAQIPAKHPKWPWILGGIAVVVLVGPYLLLNGAVNLLDNSPVVTKCTTSQNQATQAANRYANELNGLEIFEQPYTKASPTVSGDCIDTSSHTADANMDKIYASPQPLPALNQAITNGLKTKGYATKTALTLTPFTDPTEPVTFTEDFTKTGFPDLTMTYYVAHNPAQCDNTTTDTYNQCVQAYQSSFSNVNSLTATEATAEMSQDFSNNYGQ